MSLSMPELSNPTNASSSNISTVSSELRESLIRKARSGDTQAFGTLCELTRPLLERHLFSVTADRELAREITQSTFTKAFHKLKDTKPTRLYWRAWIYTIANNIVRDMWRRDRILRTFSIDEKVMMLEDADIDEYVSLTSGQIIMSGSESIAANPADLYEITESRNDLSIKLKTIMDSIDPIYARLLELSANGMTYAQISSILGISTSDVKAGLARARKEARALW